MEPADNPTASYLPTSQVQRAPSDFWPKFFFICVFLPQAAKICLLVFLTQNP